MPADMTDPKYWAIGGILYAFFMIVLWKFQIGTAEMNLTSIKIIISIVFLPVCFGIIYFMGDD